MKKGLSFFSMLVILLLTTSKSTHAQGITLGDPSIHYWVVQHFPSCVLPDGTLDPNCPEAQQVDSLHVEIIATNLSDLTYFPNLVYLDLSPGYYVSNWSTFTNATFPHLKTLICNERTIFDMPNTPVLERFECVQCWEPNDFIYSPPPFPPTLKYLKFSLNDVMGYFVVPPLLDTLICVSNFDMLLNNEYDGISYLSSLPSTLKYMDVSGNVLTSLPPLPASLTYLDCSSNRFDYTQTIGGITSLPALPQNLEKLNCSNNFIESLPELPSTLIQLNCSYNLIDSLPELPPNLEFLSTTNNLLDSLPNLPQTLRELFASFNTIDSLPTLPPNLTGLQVNNNLIDSLPALPSTLRVLYINNNRIQSIPYFPPQLISAFMDFNRLSSLPELPSTLQRLNVSGNSALSCLPLLPQSLQLLSVNGTNITVIPAQTPSINITGSTSVQIGSSATITSSIVNGGSSPLYQWQDSTASHSWTDIVGETNANITYLPEHTGVGLRCQLTSNDTCITTSNVMSEALYFEVLPAPRISTTVYPNPVRNILTIENLPTQWMTAEIIDESGRRLSTHRNPNANNISIDVSRLTAGLYIVRILDREGKPEYYKFIKL